MFGKSCGALVLAALLCAGPTANAATYYVDASQPDDTSNGLSWATAKKTIQAAVDMTTGGDTVLVTNGVYNTGARVTPGASLSNRVVSTNTIVVQSVNGPAQTFIVGAGPLGNSAVRCVFMTNGTLIGFTLTNGHTRTEGDWVNDRSGGGAHAKGAVLSNCVLSGNSTYAYGGGAFQGTLNNCTLSGNNSAEYHGGGAHGGTLNNCTLSGNSATWGGGAYNSTLNNCALSGNSATNDGGGAYRGTLNNCIVYYNAAPNGLNYFGGTLSYSCASPHPGGTGNIDAEPLFLDKDAGNYRLAAGSPCINAGNNANAPMPNDLDGNPRIVGGTVDMGAYEFQGATTHTLTIQSAYGTAVPPVGATNCPAGTVLTNRVISPDTRGTTQYVSSGWSMTGHDPTSGGGTSFVMTVTNDATLSWLWTTNFWLQTAAGPNGSVDVGAGWRSYGSNVVITATPDPYYHFTNWTGDAPGGNEFSNPLNLLMDAPKSVTASFAENLATNNTPEWWLASHGWTNNFDEAALGDQDGDGHFTWEEHIAGTIPTNSASVFKFGGLGGSGGLLKWSSSSGRLYTVEYGTNMLEGPFIVMGAASNLPANPPQNTFTNDAIVSPTLFYRVNVRRE